jgi:hypothetical protein
MIRSTVRAEDLQAPCTRNSSVSLRYRFNLRIILKRGARDYWLTQRQGKGQLDQCKAAVQASAIAELIGFVQGRADDAVAVANGCTEYWNNGMVEGFISQP